MLTRLARSPAAHLPSSYLRNQNLHFSMIPLGIRASLVAQMVKTACNAGDSGLIPGWGRSPGEGHGNPFQYSCLENAMERRAWQATVHEVAKSQGHNSATNMITNLGSCMHM